MIHVHYIPLFPQYNPIVFAQIPIHGVVTVDVLGVSNLAQAPSVDGLLCHGGQAAFEDLEVFSPVLKPKDTNKYQS